MLAKVRKPTKVNLEFLRDWLRRPEMGNFPIISEDRDTWENVDLMVLDDQSQKDALTVWLSEWLIPRFHLAVGKHIKKPVTWAPSSGLSSYSDRGVQLVVDAVVTLTSSFLPMLSIVVLSWVDRKGVRLGVIAIFTTLFSLCLSLLTRARRVDIFAATAV